jgi:PadR family transcriptional regulator PadR
MLRDFFLGSMKLHILYHADREPVFGAFLMRELSRHGYEISPGTLYPVLHSLEKDGLLVRETRVENGRARKYYRTTEKGREALQRGREKVLELVREVLDLDSDSLTLQRCTGGTDG